tara:strand:+ start:3588 stop:4421 length:834 start_codon:yes stop_codon:yes gene_type:complete
MNSAQLLIQKLWQNYSNKVPSAVKVQQALKLRNEIWIEDHIALRTFNYLNFGSRNLESFFQRYGWKTIKSDYRFPEKKLTALHMAHPETNLPKIFISQIEVEQLSNQCIMVLDKYLNGSSSQINTAHTVEEAIPCFLNTEWNRSSYEDYQILLTESQYAAWTLLFGNNVNHFTISVHLMNQLNSLDKVNSFVESLGIVLNQDNGKIKGSPNVLLEQSSTVADPILFDFSDNQSHYVPYAFIEFARRYPVNHSAHKWQDFFQGFVEGNADRIFTSTNA